MSGKQIIYVPVYKKVEVLCFKLEITSIVEETVFETKGERRFDIEYSQLIKHFLESPAIPSHDFDEEGICKKCKIWLPLNQQCSE